jgi:hypothetical protein
MKIEMILGGHAESISVYSWPNVSLAYNVVKISKANFRENPELCWQTWVKALRSLPEGFYTVVNEFRAVQDIRVGKRGGLRVKPYDGKTINIAEQLPCLRIEVEQPFQRIMMRQRA